MLDPTRRKGYYKSLIFYVEEENGTPDEKSVSILNKSISELTSTGNASSNKEPILAGILQNRIWIWLKSILN